MRKLAALLLSLACASGCDDGAFLRQRNFDVPGLVHVHPWFAVETATFNQPVGIQSSESAIS